MLDALHDTPTARWLLVVATISSIVIVFLLPVAQRQIALRKLPLVGQGKFDYTARRLRYITSAQEVYSEGYRQSHGGAFRITSNMESTTVAVGPKYLRELSRFPDSSLSALSGFEELADDGKLHQGRGYFTSYFTYGEDPVDTVDRLSDNLSHEVRHALTAELPDCSDWEEVHFSDKLIRVVAGVSGRVFVGEELCRSEEYIDHTINYTRDVMFGAQAVGKMNQWLRPFRASSLPEIQRLNNRLAKAADFFTPIVLQRLEGAKQSGWEKPDDLLQWLIDMQAAKYGDITTNELSKRQLDISFAAIHTTNSVALNAIYTLSAMPEVQAEIRQEIRKVLADHGGEYKLLTVQNMKKLDSFIRECVRFYPVGAVAFRNKILKTIILSDGTVLPEGIIIEVPVSAANKDPSLFDDPETFNHLRFYSSRQKTGDKSADSGVKNQMVSVGLDNLIFGFGKHSCPGRFFAVHVIKTIMAELLLRFEIKNAGNFQGRFPNLKHGAFVGFLYLPFLV
ncbi:hypothetical protein NM208_g6990 [Fusarium decemcellulare]|uniref:Uncharacterized protein n=2 Tax=Fusarium decemcellulare TaxID=57161 RepID=A0ACC1RSU6_9HYPO|nr:hypothetical protein NM208_g11463 [Fusarium decemcellulare]KAJ3535786.1 hypothetical protein NM208_g6990 [Fusarium decemcellulare]